MTSKERMLIAFRGGKPDRVPVSPDISNMIPASLTGKPFWEIYLYRDPPLAEAYLEAVKRYGFDGWYMYAGEEEVNYIEKYKGMNPDWEWEYEVKSSITSRPDAKVKESWIDTKHGRLKWRVRYPRDNSPWIEEGPVKDLRRDFAIVRYLMDERWLREPRFDDYEKVGDLGVFGVSISLPIDWWVRLRGNRHDKAIFDIYDESEFMDEVFNFYLQYAVKRVGDYLKAQPQPDEIVLQGSSSSMSVISPGMFRKYNLPFIEEATKLCEEAGVISHLHVCGKSREVVEMVYNETNLDVMEPLERPPSGNVDLREVKEKFGDRLALKGNVNTFETMLKGTPEDVEREAKWCIDVAAEGGGFVLATGDQVPRDTPEENILALIETAKRYGKYS